MELDPPIETRHAFQIWSKRATVFVLAALLVGAVWFFIRTDAGKAIRHDPWTFSQQVQRIVRHHWFASRIGYFSLYVCLGVLALPIWWLQLLAGVGFGLYEGTLYSLLASTTGVTISVALTRWIAADWFHQRIESRMAQLKKLDETLGHNGLLFVMTIRIIPGLPFGLLNYALGLSRASYIDIILGTFLGAIPPILVHVGTGAQYYFWSSWKFDLSVLAITFVLLLPLILRYLRPEWFKKIGVE
jgi:uncharacterized membrane protein YdjX (TVP38/TMEM64 family)